MQVEKDLAEHKPAHVTQNEEALRELEACYHTLFRHRAELVGATFSLTSAEQGGTTVTRTLPLRDTPAD
jgi:hypothetical protein